MSVGSCSGPEVGRPRSVTSKLCEARMRDGFRRIAPLTRTCRYIQTQSVLPNDDTWYCRRSASLCNTCRWPAVLAVASASIPAQPNTERPSSPLLLTATCHCVASALPPQPQVHDECPGKARRGVDQLVWTMEQLLHGAGDASRGYRLLQGHDHE